MYLLNCFFVYSILGYILEMIFGFVIGAHNVESGILYGPWTPIYGIASIFIIVLSEKLFKSLHMSRLIETIIVAFVLMIVLTILEFVGGYFIEFVFGFSFWDYSDSKFNLGKYICLEFAFIWVVLSIVFIYIINPFFEKYIRKIPLWITIFMLVLMLVDFIVRLLVEFNIIL